MKELLDTATSALRILGALAALVGFALFYFVNWLIASTVAVVIGFGVVGLGFAATVMDSIRARGKRT